MPAPRTGSSPASAADRLRARREREDALVETALTAVAMRDTAREAFQTAENAARSAIADVFELGYKDGDIAEILDIAVAEVKTARKAARAQATATEPAAGRPPASDKPAEEADPAKRDESAQEDSAD
jgi:DNA-directed RNA polymerase specialized sigma24 family protein